MKVDFDYNEHRDKYTSYNALADASSAYIYPPYHPSRLCHLA
jgi:hypothetical protein